MRLKYLIIGVILLHSISFSETKRVQFSILPRVQLISTNSDSVEGLSSNLLGAENQDVTGLDFSLLGYRKINGEFKGIHFSLFMEAFRVNGNMKGISISSWNAIKGDLSGANIGLVNIVGGNSIYQLGGINIVKKESVAQIGAINYAKQVSGLQIGLINMTKNLEGIQIGLINYAENGIIPILPIINFRKTF